VAGEEQNSKSTDQDESSDILPDMKVVIIVGCLGLAACCVSVRVCLVGSEKEESDEEKASGRVNAFEERGLWPRSPSSATSSPTGKRVKTHKAPRPSENDRKTVAQPEPVPAIVADKYAQPKKWIGQPDVHPDPPEPPEHPHRPESLPGCGPGLQTEGATLRMAALRAPAGSPRMSRANPGSSGYLREYAALQQQWRKPRPSNSN
jgi:hypothetical protein